MWKAPVAICSATLSVIFLLMAYVHSLFDWDVSVISVEGLPAGYIVSLPMTQWSTSLAHDDGVLSFLRRNTFDSNFGRARECINLTVNVTMSERDRGIQSGFGWMFTTVSWIAVVIWLCSMVYFYVDVVRHSKWTIRSVLEIIVGTLLVFMVIVIALAIWWPSTSTPLYSSIPFEIDTHCRGEVAVQQSLRGIDGTALSYLTIGLAGIVLSLVIMLWQFLSWRRSAITMKATKNTG